MGIILGIVIIVLLLYIVGVSFQLIATGLLCLMGVTVLLMTVMFTVSLVILLGGKRMRAEFSRLEDKERAGIKFAVAWYKVGEKEVPCAYPAEVAFRDRIYRGETEVIYSEKHGCVYDSNARMTCIGGFISCAAIIAAAAAVVISVL